MIVPTQADYWLEQQFEPVGFKSVRHQGNQVAAISLISQLFQRIEYLDCIAAGSGDLFCQAMSTVNRLFGFRTCFAD